MVRKTSELPKVLIVEDAPNWQTTYQTFLGRYAQILAAQSVDDGRRLFQEHRDGIVAIVMDACVPGHIPTTPPLVREFRETFTGPIIASGSMAEDRLELMEAGCDRESCTKGDVIKIVEGLLAETHTKPEPRVRIRRGKDGLITFRPGGGV